MSSINHLGINENFPVAGQDNDTQVFRDNFDTIKTNFRIAGEEITDLEDNTARIDQDNDYANYVQLRAVFQNCRDRKFDAGSVTASPTTIDYENGNYQIFAVGADLNMDFLNFPGDPVFGDTSTTVGKVTLELYGDGIGTSKNAGSFVTGRTYSIETAGNTDFTLIGSSSNAPGTVFVATGAGSGTGIAKEHHRVSFITSGSAVIKKDTNFPANIDLFSTTDPVFIEVWRHKTEVIYMRYLGQFS